MVSGRQEKLLTQPLEDLSSRPTPCLTYKAETIACANAITSGSVLGNLAILKFLSIKSYIPFSPIWCPQISSKFEKWGEL
jgi:hypothetical protein